MEFDRQIYSEEDAAGQHSHVDADGQVHAYLNAINEREVDYDE